MGRTTAALLLTSLVAFVMAGCESPATDTAPSAPEVRQQNALAPATVDTASVAKAEKPYAARGNEPGWTVTIENGAVNLSADYGELTVTAPVITDRRSGEVRTVVANNGSHYVQVSISHQPCADSMSGDKYADQVTVTLNDRSFTGCGGAHWLRNANWRLIDMNSSGIVENARLTLTFGDESRLSGSAGCNRFQGSYSLEGDRLAINPALAAAYLKLLPAMTRASIAASGALLLSDGASQQLTFRQEDDL